MSCRATIIRQQSKWVSPPLLHFLPPLHNPPPLSLCTQCQLSRRNMKGPSKNTFKLMPTLSCSQTPSPNHKPTNGWRRRERQELRRVASSLQSTLLESTNQMVSTHSGSQNRNPSLIKLNSSSYSSRNKVKLGKEIAGQKSSI